MIRRFAAVGLTLCLTACTAAGTPSSEKLDVNQKLSLPSSYSSGLYADIMSTFYENNPATEEQLTLLREWQEVNSRAFALLICEGLDICEPVLRVEDNSSWLRTNIYGEPDKAGTIFMDYRCNPDMNTVKLLHGHNMKDNTMFGNVPDLLELSDCADAPAFTLVVDGHQIVYEVFAILSVDAREEALPVPTLSDAATTRAMSADLLARSLVPGGVIHSDDLLLLNTCWYGESGMERYLHCIVAASRVA